ncbi:MAG: hypothetical protein J6X35_06075 [Bacteroidales bacterium]|nr:hypothetical protein [Bacteroidales bacterium]
MRSVQASGGFWRPDDRPRGILVRGSQKECGEDDIDEKAWKFLRGANQFRRKMAA